MNDETRINLDRARTILSRVAPKYPDLLVVRMLNNALLFGSAKFGTPLEFDVDTAGGCRCYGLEEAFETLEEAGEFTRDERTGVMVVASTLTDPCDEFAAGAADGFGHMITAMGKHPEIPGDDEDIRLFNEVLAMMLALRQDNEETCRNGECFGIEAIMELYKEYHITSPSRVERASELCQRVLTTLDNWKI